MRWRIRLIAFVCYGALLTSTAFGSPFDRMTPSNAMFYWGCDKSFQVPLPNYDKAFDNWFSLMDDILEWRVLKEEFQTIIEKSGFKENSEIFSGDKWSFALFPLLEGIPIPGRGLYITEVSDPEKAEQVLGSFLQEIDQLITPVHSVKDEYYGYLIYSLYGPLTLPGLDLAFAIKDSTLMIANSKHLLLDAIDRLEDEEGFLADLDVYKEAMSELPEKRSYTFFANYAKIGQTGEYLAKNLKSMQHFDAFNDIDEAMPIIESVLAFMHSFKSYSSAQWIDDKDRLNTVSHTRFNLSFENEVLQQMINRKPVPFIFEKYLPRKVGTVSSGNIFGPKDIWALGHSLLKDVKPVQEFLTGISQWEEENEFSIEKDILSWMGDSWCTMRPAMDLETIIATNQGASMLEITDHDAALRGIEKLASLITKTFQISLSIETETYLGKEISSLTIPIPLIPFAPSWCIHDKVMILATRPNMIREMLDIQAGVRSGIGRNRQYRFLNDVAVMPANKMSFQDNESEFYAYREAMRKMGSIPDLAFGLPDELRTLPSFVLDRAAYLMSCWQVLKGTVKHSVIQPDKIVSNEVQLINDLRIVPPVDFMSQRKISLGAKDLVAFWADWCSKSDDNERAARLYSRLVEFFPEDDRYLSKLGNLYKTMGDKDAALKVYDSVMEKMPKTASLVNREIIIDDDNIERIIERVNQWAAKTQRIDKGAALFGIALAKRDAGNASIAAALFNKAAGINAGDGWLPMAANAESALTSSGTLESVINVAAVETPVTVDGLMEEDGWRKSQALPLKMGESDSEVSLRMLRDSTNLYLYVDGDIHEDDQIKVMLCPGRDYSNVMQISVDLKQQEDSLKPQINLQTRVIDALGLTFKGESKNTFSPDDLLSEEMPEWLKEILPKDFMEKIAHKNNHPNSPNDEALSIQAAYNLNDDPNSGAKSLEISIPWEMLKTDNKQTKPVWLFNLLHISEMGESDRVLSLTGAKNPEIPFNYLMTQMR